MPSEEVLGVLAPIDDDKHPLVNDCLFTRFFPGQDGIFFGRPAWLGLEFSREVKESLECNKCRRPMRFLGQINTSKDMDNFYRFIYLFICTSCHKKFTAIRGYLSHFNPLYYPSALDESAWGVQCAQRAKEVYQLEPTLEPPTNVMDIDLDQLTATARERMLRDDDLRGRGVCGLCFVPINPEGSVDIHQISSEEEAVGGLRIHDWLHACCFRKLTSHTIDESVACNSTGIEFHKQFELLGRIRDDFSLPALPALGIEEHERLLDDSAQQITAEQADDLENAMTQEDRDEVDIKDTYGEELRLKDSEGLVPVIRYHPGSSEVKWMTGNGTLKPSVETYPATGWKSSSVQVPNCALCGSPKSFTCQIYSSVCNYAGQELDIGTLVVFECSSMCSPDLEQHEGNGGYVQGYVVETCYVQFDDTAVNHKIMPRLF
eukprot:GHVH01002551.1.p1 GENE.GHVH01002551.1~~GHVH01002551.1.p1  ORF type:complete len:477 (+),score=47.26 GHVH01002551.1:138-1433(+)